MLGATAALGFLAVAFGDCNPDAPASGYPGWATYPFCLSKPIRER
jgi:hypothetical protein